jgi:signal transduction histidine kinase
VKYDGKSNSEIGVLGENFNHMSETLEKTINELREANKKLLKDVEQKTLIEKMRTEFISNVSHELKTPIALISGYAEGLKDGINSDPESTEYYLDVIIDETKKMNYMVKELTKLMQLELGDGDLDLDEFDLNQVINNCLETYGLLFDEKKVNVVTNINKTESLNIVANEYHIEEVIRNYINNALNHVEGDMRIEVTAKRQDEYAYFSVFNTGKPIPEESLEYIWDKFYKVDKARTRAYGGSGIGLSIVKAISEMSGAKCGVINKEEGVEFWFKIALNKSCP